MTTIHAAKVYQTVYVNLNPNIETLACSLVRNWSKSSIRITRAVHLP